MNEKIKVLLVDNDFEFLYLLEDKLEDSEKIEIKIFDAIKDKNVGLSFIDYLKKNKDMFIADVIFCDYALENGVTALDILKEAQEISSIPPIVVMTANESSLQQESIDSINGGARDYIIKSSSFVGATTTIDYFLQELHISAMRIHKEQQQRNVHSIITDMGDSREIDTIEKLVTKFIDTVTKYYPYFTLISRRYQGNQLCLQDTTIEDEAFREEIRELNIEEANFLGEVINNESGTKINNTLKNGIEEFNPETKKIVTEYNLNAGLFIRIGTKDNPLGTLSIYATNILFSDSHKKSFKLISQSLTREWKILDAEIRKEEALTFIDNSVKQDDERKIWDDLCKLMHKQFNKDSTETKTTIKVASVGSNILQRDYCEGLSCDVPQNVEISNKSVSSWVYRNKHFICIDSDSFVDVDEKDKRLTNMFIDTVCKEGRDRDIAYYQTHDTIKSGICIPISVDNQVLGVLNLESPKENAYTHTTAMSIRKEIENLIKIPARRIVNIRQDKFMKSMIMTISKEKYKDRFEEAKTFLKDFVGYNVFIVAIENKGRLELEEFDIVQKKDGISLEEYKEKINTCINKKSAIKDFVENAKEEFLYINIMKNYKGIVSGNNDGKAQFLAKLSSGNRNNGVISFQFEVENPLDDNKIKLLQGFISWLNRDINENIKNKALRDRERYFREKSSMDWYFRNLSHIIGGSVGNIGANLELIEACSEDNNAIIGYIENSQKYLQSIANFPKRFISSKEYSFDTIKGAYSAVMEDLSLRVGEKTLTQSLEKVAIATSHTSKLYMILFHPILNALEEKSVSHIEINGKQEDETYVLTIKDNGNGFHNLGTLFTRNITNKSSGSGFGLYHIKALIENELDGVIEASNNDGGIITIMLPLTYEGETYEV